MAADTTGAAPEQPPAEHPTVPPGGTRARRPTHDRRRRPARVVAAVALTAGAVAVWELGAIHDDGPLLGGEPWGWGSCLSRSEAGLVDWTIGGVLAEPSRDVVVLDVRAVRAQNVVVREGTALPFVGDRDGDGDETILGEAAGYPPADLLRADVVWAQGEPLVGTRLVHGAAVNLTWRAEVRDPSVDASYEAVEVEYRSGHRRYVAVVDHDLLIPGGVDPEACFTR